MEFYIDALKKYADFSGRARRKEYWMFILCNLIISIALGIVDEVLGTAILSLVYALAMIVPSISVAARRLHDTGRSGWWQLISLVPLIGIIVLIVFLAQAGGEENDYGVNPKLA